MDENDGGVGGGDVTGGKTKSGEGGESQKGDTHSGVLRRRHCATERVKAALTLMVSLWIGCGIAAFSIRCGA